MELQRRAILKEDFSTSRRGYDPAEVDAHLAEIADAVEQMRGTSTAGAAAQRVQSIVEAAERSAQEIETEAQAEAEQRRGQASEIRTAAEEQAERVRRRAQEQVDTARKRVQSDTAAGLERAAEAERLLKEAGGELDRLRSALSKLRGALEQPVERVEVEADQELSGEPKAQAPKGTRRRREAQARAAEEQAAEEASAQEAAEEQAEPATAHAELPEADEAVEETQESPAQAAHDAAPQSNKGGQPKDGAEGARLIALNMALNGTPREETQRYLAENFELDDLDGLLDEVYSG